MENFLNLFENSGFTDFPLDAPEDEDDEDFTFQAEAGAADDDKDQNRLNIEPDVASGMIGSFRHFAGNSWIL